MHAHSLVWLRRDLRLSDNTALMEALENSIKVSLLFIFDEHILKPLPRDDRRITFIWESLQDLKERLIKNNAPPVTICYGFPEQIFKQIFFDFRPDALYCNHDYEPYAILRDNDIKRLCKENGIEFFSFKDQVLFEKSEITKEDRSAYKVFTAYKNKWLVEFEKLPPDNGKHRMDFAKLMPLALSIYTRSNECLPCDKYSQPHNS